MRITKRKSRRVEVLARGVLIAAIGTFATFCATAASSGYSQVRTGPYRLVASIPGGDADGLWDYASIDAAGRRLYLAQEGVTMLDLKSGQVSPHFVTGRPFQGLMPTHHVLPVNGGQTLAVTDVATNSVDFFDSRTGMFVSSVSVGPRRKQDLHNPDGLLYEPKSQLLIAVDGDSSSLSLIDTTAFAKRGEISVGKGKLEAGVADGTGLVYINEEVAHSIAVIDIGKRRLLHEIALQDCEEPTGIAFDPKDRLVISVCSNGIAKFISAKTDTEVASVQVGQGADGVVYDPDRGYAFSFGGDDGSVSIIGMHDPNRIALVQTLKTKPSARLGALDPRTGRLYIPAAVFGPPAAPITVPGVGSLPGLNPHTFEFLVVAPSSP